MSSEIRLKGDWRKLRHLANELESVKDIDDTLMPEVANKVKEALEVAVGSNPPPVNAESTLRKPYKKGKGTFQETGGFPDNIVVDETKERNRSVYLIRGSDSPQGRDRKGVPPTYKELIGILSTGSPEKNIPKRDVLRMAYDMVEGEIKYMIVSNIKSMFR